MGAATVNKIGMGVTAFGAGVSAVSAYNKSKGEKYAYEYQAQMARNNAQLAEWQAQDAVTRGASAEGNQRLKVASFKSSQRASMAARGIALDEGSPLDILVTTDVMGEADALTVRDNASREAWALREQGKGYTANAGLLQMRGNSESPLMAAGSTLLTGAASVASQWYNYKKVS